jgi:hypothetical protein
VMPTMTAITKATNNDGSSRSRNSGEPMRQPRSSSGPGAGTTPFGRHPSTGRSRPCPARGRWPMTRSLRPVLGPTSSSRSSSLGGTGGGRWVRTRMGTWSSWLPAYGTKPSSEGASRRSASPRALLRERSSEDSGADDLPDQGWGLDGAGRSSGARRAGPRSPPGPPPRRGPGCGRWAARTDPVTELGRQLHGHRRVDVVVLALAGRRRGRPRPGRRPRRRPPPASRPRAPRPPRWSGAWGRSDRSSATRGSPPWAATNWRNRSRPSPRSRACSAARRPASGSSAWPARAAMCR